MRRPVATAVAVAVAAAVTVVVVSCLVMVDRPGGAAAAAAAGTATVNSGGSKSAGTKGRQVSAKNSYVWGPGLNPAIVTPARVFYVTAVDTNGAEFQESPGPGFAAEVQVVHPNGKRARLKTQWYDLGDGSFMGLYVYTQVGARIIIKITYRGQPVGESPYQLGDTTIEACDCPHETMEDFLYNYGCATSDPADQIATDLQPFAAAGGITKELIDDTMHLLDRNDSCYVHYVIKDNKIYGQGHGPMQGFKGMMDEMLLSLASKTPLPDVEFLLNLGDWPLVPHTDDAGHQLEPRPVFSWCSSTHHYDLVLPTYKMTMGTLFGKDIEKVQVIDGQAGEHAVWKKKRDVAFFRGRPSNQARVEAMLLSRKRPDLIDAAITKNQFNYFPNEEARREHHAFEAKYGKKASIQPMATFFKYKYLLNIDGTVAAYRFPAMLAGTSTIFKQESDYYEHFYNALEPWKHHVPVARNLSDLIDRVQYARAHDEEMQSIARAGREFTRRHLRMPDMYCYHLRALLEYSRVQTYTPEVPDGMKEVVSDKLRKPCSCPAFEKPPTWDILVVGGTAIIGLVVLVASAGYQRAKRKAAAAKRKQRRGPVKPSKHRAKSTAGKR